MTENSPGFPYIEVSLDNLLFNLDQLRLASPYVKDVIAVVKDCAYGCGAIAVSKALEAHGVHFFAVANCKEARSLRNNGITSPILVFGECGKDELRWGSSHNIHFSLNDCADIAAWKTADFAVRFHCEIDTGMGRLGLNPTEIGNVIHAVTNSDQIVFEGLFTHFANADEPATKTVEAQLNIFKMAIANFKAGGLIPKYIHYANSAATIRFPFKGECTHIRPGISLYGCKPDPKQIFPIPLKSVVRLKSKIIKIKNVPANTPISYGGTYTTKSETKIATIPLGYGIGFPRQLSNKGSVLIGGKRYGIAGRVTMDYVMVDIGFNSNIQVDDEVVVFGDQGDECITVDEVALLADTIGYEILCGLSPCLDRIYAQDGKIVSQTPGYSF